MGLISTRQYDRAIRFVTETARKIRTSPPVRILRRIHAQSFAETQRAQAAVERQYQLQQRSRARAKSSERSFPAGDRLPPTRDRQLQLGAWRDLNSSQASSHGPKLNWQSPQSDRDR